MDNRRATAGRYGETAAKGYLAAKGYEILAERYKAGAGEIDIIAKDSGCLVFVEVKYRKQASFGSPAASITAAKRRAIAQTAEYYIAEMDLADADCRFDVVEVFGREQLDINHIEDAFWL